jgi:hypothetical protein
MPYEINTGKLKSTTIHELLMRVSRNFVQYRSVVRIGDAMMRCNSSEIKKTDSAVMILLKMSIDKKVTNTMERSFVARTSPNPSTPFK